MQNLFKAEWFHSNHGMFSQFNSRINLQCAALPQIYLVFETFYVKHVVSVFDPIIL